jgi:hypothetical protein
VPFRKNHELCKDLQYIRENEKSGRLKSTTPLPTLPDAPRIRIDHSSAVIAHCLQDLETPSMNTLGEKLWRAGPTPDVVSLTQHTVLDRRIQVTEDPSMHLLWVGSEAILFVKPLPAYLASHAFWEYLTDECNSEIDLEERKRLLATSLGFLKTYASLVKHRSDFNLARRHDLLASFSTTSFEEFVRFIAYFDDIPDSAISSRWRYGLVQLDALNFHSMILQRWWHLNRFESRYTTYFSRFFPVVLFIFALFSVMLSAMQVIVAAKQLWDTDNKGLKRVLGLFIWFSMEAMGWSLGFGVMFMFWWIVISTSEAFSRRAAKKKVQQRLKNESVCT